MIFDLFLSSSTRKVRRSEEKKNRCFECNNKNNNNAYPSFDRFRVQRNLFSYVRLPVSKSVESIVWVSEMCPRERERTKREEIKINRSPRARLIEKRVRRTFRAFRDVWVVLRHGGGGAFFFCACSSVSL